MLVFAPTLLCVLSDSGRREWPWTTGCSVMSFLDAGQARSRTPMG